MKKIISTLLILLIILPMCVVNVGAEESDVVKEDLGLVYALGIDQNEPGTIAADAKISRSSYLKMIVRAVMNLPEYNVNRSQPIFFDVDITSELAGYVEAAYDLGIITGQPDGRFCPDDNISYIEALIMAIRAIGGGEVAEYEGGYTAGYTVVANRTGISDGISAGTDDEISYEQALRIIYNMLISKTVEGSSESGLQYTEINLLKKVFNVTKSKGRVEATSVANIYGDTRCEEGRVVIDSVFYDVVDEYDGKYAGYDVVYYSREAVQNDGARRKIIYMYAANEKEIVVDADDMISYTPGQIKYDDNGKERDIAISPKAITLVNNCRATIPASGYTLSKNGEFMLVDNNGDNAIDLVLISEYKYGVVKNITDNKIYFSNEKIYSVDLEGYDKYVIEDKEGNPLTLEEISKDAVMQVYETADNGYLKILVSMETATIKVMRINEEDDGVLKLYHDDGTVYETIYYFDTLIKDNVGIKPETTYVFALDCSGKIVAVLEKMGENDFKYAYIISSRINSAGFEKSAEVRVYTEAGAIEELKLSDKAKNEKTELRTSAEDFIAGCEDGKPIRYKQNSKGEISVFEFAGAKTDKSGFREGATTDTTNNPVNRFYKSTGMLGGEIILDSGTVMFMAPETPSGDAEDYYALRLGDMTNEKYYHETTAYICDDDIYAEVIIQKTTSEAKVGSNDARMIVSDVCKSFDSATGENNYEIVGYVNGKEKIITLNEEDLLSAYTVDKAKNNVENGQEKPRIKVAKGDVIRYAVDKNGKAIYIKMVFDYSDGKVYGTNGTDNSEKYGADVKQLYAIVTEKEDNYFRIRLADENGVFNVESPYYYALTSNTYIYEYDAENKRQPLSVITADEIVSLEQDPGNTDRVVMITSKTTLPFMVVYK